MKLTICACLFALAAAFIPLSQADAGTYICTIAEAGPVGAVYQATLTYVSTVSGAWTGPSRRVSLPSKEFLAAALTAIAGGKKVKVTINETTWTCNSMFVQK